MYKNILSNDIEIHSQTIIYFILFILLPEFFLFYTFVKGLNA